MRGLRGTRVAWAGAKHALVAALVLACSACAKEAPRATSGPPLHLSPTTDLAQGAGLQWIVDVTPRALASDASLAPALAVAMPKERTGRIAEEHGGIDPMALDELVVASYAGDAHEKWTTALWLARGAIDPDAVETAFKRRAESVDGRAIDRPGDADPGTALVRAWGTVDGAREQIAIFGRAGAALEVGHFGPLKVAELFAQERLKRAVPALRVPAIARSAGIVAGAEATHGADDAPRARAFALGPFEGEDAKALGGLLAACTAVGVEARVTRSHDQAAIVLTFALVGAWNGDARAAAERLRAAFDAIGVTPLGKLMHLDRPLEPALVDAIGVAGLTPVVLAPPTPAATPPTDTSPSQPTPQPTPQIDALRLRVTVDALELARGLRAATGGEVLEMMSY